MKHLVVPAAGGGAVKYNFDPDFNLSHGVVGAAVAAGTHLALSISVSVPRGQEPEVPGFLALLAVWGDHAVLGRTETYEIKGYRSDGSLARIVRRDFEPGTPTQAEQDTHFRELLARYSEERRAQGTEVAANVPLVDAFPAFGAVVGDALGHLWVAEFKRPGDDYVGTLWTVFDGDGRMLGLVATPAIVTVFEIGEDYILGEATDELGVEYVQMWGLDRQASMDLTGCYDVTEGEWVVEQTVPGEDMGLVPSELGYDSVDYQIPPRIQFAGPSDRRFSATDVVVPEGALPTPHRYPTGEIIGDSLVLVFSTGHVGVRATLARSGTGWAGTARTWVDHTPQQVSARPVELTQVPCDSPPPVSSDVMPPVPRTVELESGLAITLGEPLPASLETVAPEPDSVQLGKRATRDQDCGPDPRALRYHRRHLG